jgi:hypothetical protein
MLGMGFNAWDLMPFSFLVISLTETKEQPNYQGFWKFGTGICGFF